MKKIKWSAIIAGLAAGLAAVLLTAFGNPPNMGFCIACFIRDIAGGLGLHGAAKVQYIRPEIVGLVLGACLMALIKKEFRPKGGSSPATRFLLGNIVMIGALTFLGCPLRMVIRLGGGDLNALVALFGFAAGIGVGVLFLNKGFSLKRNYTLGAVEGFALPAGLLLLGALAIAMPSLFKASEAGPGSRHASVWLALGVSLIVGALAQRSRLCFAGGLRDTFMFKDLTLLWGFIAVFVAVLAGNLCFGSFKLGFRNQPVAHSAWAWNFLGMFLVGWGSVLLGGCPLRQLILTGEGNGDSAVTVLGMLFGAAISHNFGLAGAADSVSEAGEYIVGGISVRGKIVVICCIATLLAVSLLNLPKKEKTVATAVTEEA